jgi:cyclopropane fatty-acyl-phospholipid synthase-like methyltransferase
MINHFKDSGLNAEIEENGFAIVPFAGAEELREIADFYHSLPKVDAKGTYVTMFHPAYDYRKKVDLKIKELFEEKATALLPGYEALFANFMVKESGQEGYFPVHQDWTYVDETRFASYALWIPTQDVNIDNGALHVVRGSHRLLTALRGPNVHEPFAHLSDVIREKYSEPIHLKAGEALVWDHRLIHFSLPNTMPVARLAFTLIMVPRNAERYHCWGADEYGTKVAKYAVDTEFYLKNTIGQEPANCLFIETIEQKPIAMPEEIFDTNQKPAHANYKEQSREAAEYYDKWQQRYNDVYGDVIQAFRPGNKDELMKYLANSIGFRAHEQVLDAGCGVAGPAIWLAKNFDIKISGLTISEAQAKQATDSVGRNKLQDRIDITQGDYHELTQHYSKSSFDKVLFLESLGHAGNAARVIAEAFEVLKPGGNIYIKDFYVKEPTDEYWQKRIEKTIANINKFYSYKTLNLITTISALRSVGFEIDFIRKFDFKDDISIRFDFESKFGIDIFEGEPEFYPAEWLEIKCIKPTL